MNSPYVMPEEDRLAIEALRIEVERQIELANVRFWKLLWKAIFMSIIALVGLIIISRVLGKESHLLNVLLPLSIIQLAGAAAISGRRDTIERGLQSITDPRAISVFLDRGNIGQAYVRPIAVRNTFRLLLQANKCSPYYLNSRAMDRMLNQMMGKMDVEDKLRYVKALEFLGNQRAVLLITEIQSKDNQRFWKGMSPTEKEMVTIEFNRILPIIEMNCHLMHEHQRLLRAAGPVEELLRPVAGNSTDVELLLRAETLTGEIK